MKALAICLATIIATISSFASIRMPDENRGKNVFGVPETFSISFPKGGQHSVTGMCEVILSDGTKPDNPMDYVKYPMMLYRWRYFDSVENVTNRISSLENWNFVPMVHHTNNILRTVREIEIPDGNMDFEFFFRGISAGPYYSYVDYTGLKVGVPGYSEENLKFVMNAQPKAKFVPTFGDKTFYRVRRYGSEFKGAVVQPDGN